ncbi:MAG TPA: four helix bundle protein [Candidatus Nealsonbacteria bacterium]|uniref:Four helix bundle protein n=1 Tax=marine sediment metagenome TaxID=412755 RepID=A0A0F9UJU5_9ZZZZ|nr:four helix bundle protein [Candidatus Nealsonbacteria bacterium]HEB46589.1 four helix bundle protein [Candidatus Nealsonbacteria bacterium]
MSKEQTKNILLEKADKLAFQVYQVSKKFPKSELFGLTSQVQRSALSIPLNIIEGFARQRPKEYVRFLEVSYASLKETKYLLYFAHREKYITKIDYEKIIQLAEEIGKIIWSKINKLKQGIADSSN